ncbi:MAG: chorismate-binding protein [Pyrinomonadaceae bacterium]
MDAVSHTLLTAAAPQDLEIIAPQTVLKTSNFTREQYTAAVRRIKEHIFAGDIYQANLTQQFACELDAETSARTIFERLRRDHPAPFAAYIVRRDDTIVSASPERFLRVRHVEGERRMIEAWPIKGTRPRGRDAREDARLRAELLASGKDRAENVMIVDLLRNDLGRICRYGSIEVAALCALESILRCFTSLRASPASCASRSRRMRCCARRFLRLNHRRSENSRDGDYSRSRGSPARPLDGRHRLFSFDGSCDLNVAIRTIVVRGRTARFNVGGGIVADSTPISNTKNPSQSARFVSRLGSASKDEG